jgi:FlaA1/EpsC-like NDP-sugar epimerase
VLDSSGSVIPKFRKQIRAGGPVTVTHPDVTRYFMTIPEAAELVLQANGLSDGGDVFILDMGQPVKIDDLARKLIHLSGLSLKDDAHPDGDIAIAYTGTRPGEKLFEELLIDEAALPTAHPKIWRANECAIPWEALKTLLNGLEVAFRDDNRQHLRTLLSRPEIAYHPAEEDT